MGWLDLENLKVLLKTVKTNFGVSMNYEAALDYIKATTKHGIKLGLERVGRILWHLGNPQNQFRSIHIAGTNGKGSTAAFYGSVLEAAGYKTGRYTSPHLASYRERFMVDGQMISKTKLAGLVGAMQPAIAAVISEGLGEPTEFEVGTVLAFQFFAEQQVEIAVVEVGMGGRFDATNVLQPILTVITHLALDHQQYLGDSLSAIAFEKAGIIKPGVPVVIGEQLPELEEFLVKTAKERQAPYRLAREIRAEKILIRETGSTFQALAGQGLLEITIGLIGRHQIQNSLNLVAGLDLLTGTGLVISQAAIKSGLAKAGWPGRLERVIISNRCTLYLDGAHNPDGVKMLVATLSELYPGQKFDFLIGILANRPLREMITLLAGITRQLIVTTVPDPKSAPATELAALGVELGVKTVLEPDPAKALQTLLATTDKVAVACGSLYLIGLLRAQLFEMGD